VLVDALLGGGQAPTRSPFDPFREQIVGTQDSTQNIDIIESALRVNDNFDKVLEQQDLLRQSNFFATGPGRGADLTQLENLIAANGIQFNPRRVTETEANQAAVSDLIQAMDVIVQLNRVLDTPPLTLLVNPQSLAISYAKKQSYQDRNRFNYIFQSWGEEQVRLSVSGRSAGFVAGSRGRGEPGRTATVSGYQWVSKWDSAAWQNMMALFAFYRNNGYIYDTSGSPPSEAHLFAGHIELSYDQWVYLGNFDSFDYSYDEGQQHGGVTFNFDFTVSFMFDRGQDSAVRPFDAPPTPTPSSTSSRRVPFVPNQQSKATKTVPSAEDADPSTAILDLLVNTFGSSSPVQSRPGGRTL
jgi:hypothetical protein